MNITFGSRHRPYKQDPIFYASFNYAKEKRKDNLAERERAISAIAGPNTSPENLVTIRSMYDQTTHLRTTARELLLTMDFVPTPPNVLDNYSHLHDELWTSIECLAKCGVYLLHTNHLSDIDLYSRLYYKIFDEECAIMPPSNEAHEYIDCMHEVDRFFLNDQIDTSTSKNESIYARGPICKKFTREAASNAFSHSRDFFLPRPDSII
jgi:hypothetical protein